MKVLLVIGALLCGLLSLGVAWPLNAKMQRPEWIFVSSGGCKPIPPNPSAEDPFFLGCDMNGSACVMTTKQVPRECPRGALYQRPIVNRLINVQMFNHVVRIYEHNSGFCYFTVLPDCPAPRAKAQADDECKSVELPTGEVIYDPVGCKSSPTNKQHAEGQEGQGARGRSREDILAALVELMMRE